MRTIISDWLKRRIYEMTCEMYEERYGSQHAEMGGCMYWANCGGYALRTATDLRVLVQAGSMQWPIVPPEEDDGKMMTHFQYEWSPDRWESQEAIKAGKLPEIHVWLGLPELNQIVDFSTKFLPAAARREGLQWRTPPPPDYLWCPADQLPEGVTYRPDMDAIRFILNKVWADNCRAEGVPVSEHPSLCK